MSTRSGQLLLRVARGDVAAARASLIVVGHLNGVAPGGAEAAIDRALGGAITRRATAGALDSHFGASHFIPAANAPLAADAVLVLGLGEPGKLDERRLPELGAAIVEAMTSVRARDAATVVHGAGSLGLPLGRAARLLVEGFLRAAHELEDADEIRELTLVERELEGRSARIASIRRVLRRLEGDAVTAIAVDPSTLNLGDAAAETVAETAVPRHLRIAVNRAGSELRVTMISESAFDPADRGDYPQEKVLRLLVDLREGILRESDPRRRVEAMRGLGGRLHQQFFSWPRFDLVGHLRRARDDYLVLRLDESTVDLPWELMTVGDQYLSLSHLLARQREIVAPGHAAAFVPPHDRLRALVVGDPTDDLPLAAREAKAVARQLGRLGADVRSLGPGATQSDVLELLRDFDPDVMHYAGHARFDDVNQAAGGLLLADGTLTAGALAGQPRLPRLFFANGCSTAQTGDVLDQATSLGLPDEALEESLRKAAATRDFAGGVLRAGARAFVGSQWAVGDAAAASFAQAFYRQLTRGRERPASGIGAAVRAARRAVIRAHGMDDPAWAGYALYGSPWAAAL